MFIAARYKTALQLIKHTTFIFGQIIMRRLRSISPTNEIYVIFVDKRTENIAIPLIEKALLTTFLFALAYDAHTRSQKSGVH